MNKYKIVGIIDIILGILLFLPAVSIIFIVIPQLNTLYSSLNLNSNSNVTTAYAASFVILLINVINILLGLKLFKVTNKTKSNLFLYGILSAILSILLSGTLYALVTISTVSPIYNLSSQIQ